MISYLSFIPYIKMKRRLTLILTLATLLPALTSCEDWLDVSSPSARPTTEFFQSPTQAEQALLGVYNGLLPLPEYILLMSDGRSDDVWTEPADDKQRDYVDISVFNPNIYTTSTLDNAWNDLYKIVARANLFLEKVEPIEFEPNKDGVDVKTTFMAEARFLRAYAYFELVRYFGRVPISVKSLTQEEAMSIPQSEAEEVYAQVIVPDLRYAVDHLQETAYDSQGNTAEAGRATQTAAKAMLGRVYLTMAGYPLEQTEKKDSAAILLKDVIDYAESTGKYWAQDAEEWKRIWISDNDNKYHIFEIQYVAEKDYGNPIVFLSVPNVGTDYIGIQMSGNRITCDTGLAELFEEYPGDTRYEATVDPERNYFTKFFEHKIKRAELGFSDIDGQIVDRTYFPINYPLIRLEDVMLMYAEIVGPTPEGIELVNRIRMRAGLPELSAEQQTEEAFAQCVDDERRRELAFEGIRWHDIVRHHTYIESVQAKFMRMAADENGNIIRPTYLNYVNNVQEGTYIYPIPDTQMKAREGLYQQNEAYR